MANRLWGNEKKAKASKKMKEAETAKQMNEDEDTVNARVQLTINKTREAIRHTIMMGNMKPDLQQAGRIRQTIRDEALQEIQRNKESDIHKKSDKIWKETCDKIGTDAAIMVLTQLTPEGGKDNTEVNTKTENEVPSCLYVIKEIDSGKSNMKH